MIFADGALGLLLFGLWIFCIIDVITTPDGAVRNLPKLLWLVIVVLLPEVGSIAWLVAGRPWGPSADLQYKGNRGVGSRGAPGVPSRSRGGLPAAAPGAAQEFLAGLRARAEEQRRRAREQQGEQPSPE